MLSCRELPPPPGGVYSEGTFRFTGAPVTRAAITCLNGVDSDGGDVKFLALDNLICQTLEPRHTLAARQRVASYFLAQKCVFMKGAPRPGRRSCSDKREKAHRENPVGP